MASLLLFFDRKEAIRPEKSGKTRPSHDLRGGGPNSEQARSPKKKRTESISIRKEDSGKRWLAKKREVSQTSKKKTEKGRRHPWGEHQTTRCLVRRRKAAF